MTFINLASIAKVGVFLWVLFLLLIVSPLVAGKQPFEPQSSGIDTIDIEFPKFEVFKAHEPITLHFHVHNSSGYLLSNLTANCSIHIYNSTGAHIVIVENMDYSNLDFEYTITGDESLPGVYAYTMECNNSEQAGFVSESFDITVSGAESLDTTSGVSITLFIMIIALGLIIISLSVPRFSDGEISNLVIKRGMMIVGVYLMGLNSAIIATIAGQAGLPVTGELFTYTWLLLWAGWALIFVLSLKTLFDVVDLWRTSKRNKRMGENL